MTAKEISQTVKDAANKYRWMKNWDAAAEKIQNETGCDAKTARWAVIYSHRNWQD